MSIVAVKDGRYTAAGQIDCLVQFEESGDFIPFTASSEDTTDYGQQLFTDLLAGKYGQVTPFTITQEIIESARQRKHAEISAWRDQQENGNILFTLNGHRWDCGKASQARLAPVVSVARAGILPQGFFWTDADNIDVPMTPEALTTIESAMQQNMVLQGFKIHERQRQMKEEVDNLTDYNAILGYVIGWKEMDDSGT